MDISTLLKKIEVSRWTLFWKGLFCGKGSVAEYLLDKANTAASALPGQTKQNCALIYARLAKIYDALDTLDWAVPKSWLPYYTGVMRVYGELIETLRDGRVEMGEITSIVDKCKLAYATWKADDVAEVD